MRLEGQPEQRDATVAQRPEMVLELADHPALLELVDLDHAGQQLEGVAGVAGQLLQRGDVLREAAAAVADAGTEEALADALVEAHAAGDLLDVGADALADVRDLVDEGDLGGEERIRCELDHLGGGRVGAEDRRLEIAVETRYASNVIGAVAADHDAIWLAEVSDGRALAQELRVRHVANVLAAARIELGANALAGTDRHGRFHHQDRALGTGRQRVDHALHAGEVRIARRRRRRIDADDRDPRLAEDVLHIEREGEALGVALQQLGHPGLVDWDLAALEQRHAFRIDVTADDGMAELCQAGGRHEPDVADADDADGLASAHRVTSLKLFAMAIIAEFGIRPVNEFSSQ